MTTPKYEYVCADCAAIGSIADSLDGEINHCPECGSDAVLSVEAGFLARVHRGPLAPDERTPFNQAHVSTTWGEWGGPTLDPDVWGDVLR